MALYEFEGKRPKIADSAFVSESAVVIGNVEIGENCFIGPNCVIRGDWGRIVIGNKSNVQGCCVIHARPDDMTKIGNRVSVGHASMLHNCTIRDQVTIGMNATVSDYAVVGEKSIIAEGCVVRNSQEIPPASAAAGVPAKIIAKLTEEQIATHDSHKDLYAGLAARCHKSLKRIEE